MKPGIYYGMPFAEYLAVDAVSSSAIKLMARSAWHYKNRVEVEQTPAMFNGTLAHCAVLEPDAVAARYVVTPADAPRRPTKSQMSAKNPSSETLAQVRWWDNFAADIGQREIVSAEQYALCQEQAAAVAREPELSCRLAIGKPEVSLFWNDPKTGLFCKARPDSLCQESRELIDVKTCTDESPAAFGRTVARMKYDIQAAHYLAGVEAILGGQWRFIFGAVTSKRPVLAMAYELLPEHAQSAREVWRGLIDHLALCESRGVWPAYGSGVLPIDLPAYYTNDGEIEIEWSDES